VFFFEDFLNFSTRRHTSSFFRRFRHALENNNTQKTFREEEREKERLGRESSRLGGFYGGIGRGVTRFVVFC
jgi:hypothetical protein